MEHKQHGVRRVQSVLVRDDISLVQARAKVRALGYTAGKVHHSDGHYRFRQFDSKKVGVGGCRTVKIADKVSLVYCDVRQKATRAKKRKVRSKRRAKRTTSKRRAKRRVKRK
jgi:hypothetical protein